MRRQRVRELPSSSLECPMTIQPAAPFEPSFAPSAASSYRRPLVACGRTRPTSCPTRAIISAIGCDIKRMVMISYISFNAIPIWRRTLCRDAEAPRSWPSRPTSQSARLPVCRQHLLRILAPAKVRRGSSIVRVWTGRHALLRWDERERFKPRSPGVFFFFIFFIYFFL